MSKVEKRHSDVKDRRGVKEHLKRFLLAKREITQACKSYMGEYTDHMEQVLDQVEDNKYKMNTVVSLLNEFEGKNNIDCWNNLQKTNKKVPLKPNTRNLPTLRFKSTKRSSKTIPTDRPLINFTPKQRESCFKCKFPEPLFLESKKLKQCLIMKRHRSIFQNKRIRDFKSKIQFKIRQLY